MASVEPGAILSERFEIISTLSQGGTAEVFEAKDIRSGDVVAVRVLHESFEEDADLVARFARQVRLASALESKHAARTLDCGVADGRAFVVTELLRGIDLADELKARVALPLEEAAVYVTQACDALIEAHDAGLVHGDLEPANLFLLEDGGRRTVKVLGFGIARLERDHDGEAVTPLRYMPPEAFGAAKVSDARSDVWSLAVVFYQCVTGILPFLGDDAASVEAAIKRGNFASPSAHRAALPRAVDVIVGRALKKEPAARYQSARELVAALEVFLPHGRNDTLQFQQIEAPPNLPAPEPAEAKGSVSSGGGPDAPAGVEPTTQRTAGVSSPPPGTPASASTPPPSDGSSGHVWRRAPGPFKPSPDAVVHAQRILNVGFDEQPERPAASAPSSAGVATVRGLGSAEVTEFDLEQATRARPPSQAPPRSSSAPEIVIGPIESASPSEMYSIEKDRSALDRPPSKTEKMNRPPESADPFLIPHAEPLPLPGEVPRRPPIVRTVPEISRTVPEIPIAQSTPPPPAASTPPPPADSSAPPPPAASAPPPPADSSAPPPAFDSVAPEEARPSTMSLASSPPPAAPAKRGMSRLVFVIPAVLVIGVIGWWVATSRSSGAPPQATAGPSTTAATTGTTAPSASATATAETANPVESAQSAEPVETAPPVETSAIATATIAAVETTTAKATATASHSSKSGSRGGSHTKSTAKPTSTPSPGGTYAPPGI